ncbi:uncharacterized protein LOC110855645 isoform X2 [Folsomia candida]|nr:uncharacterized protein LOC110855645 isoform X2 [Folsomia candida]
MNSEDDKKTTCLTIIRGMMAENVKLKPIMQFWPEKLLLTLIRTYDSNHSSVLDVVNCLQTCITETYPELFGLINLSKLRPVLDKKLFSLVKHASPKNPGILMFKFKNWKPSDVSPDQLTAVATVYYHQLGRNSKDIQKNGILVLLDAEGLGFSHVRQMSHNFVKKVLYCNVYTSPVRVIGYVVYNSSFLMEKIYNVLKHAVPERSRKDVYILRKDLTQLHEMVPDKQFLPTCVGGEVPNDVAFQEDAEIAALEDLTMQNLVTDLQREYGLGKK